MSKTQITEAQLGMPAAVISHTFIRLRGTQTAEMTVLHAATESVRVNLLWGGILWAFRRGRPGCARCDVHRAGHPDPAARRRRARAQEPYDRPTVAIDWWLERRVAGARLSMAISGFGVRA